MWDEWYSHSPAQPEADGRASVSAPSVLVANTRVERESSRDDSALVRISSGQKPRAKRRDLVERVETRWIARPSAITLGKFSCITNLVYFGHPSDARERHRALIDPALTVLTDTDRKAIPLPETPSYAKLSPEERHIYIEWLAGGRSDPSVPIGYVLLFFYGLERRLITERGETDAPAIIFEVERLMGIYGGDQLFAYHARALREAGIILFSGASFPLRANLGLRLAGNFPVSVKLALGRKIEARLPLGAEDALIWAISHPQIFLTAPIRRCFTDFKRIWHHRFSIDFPNGMTVRPPRSRLHFHYRAASGDFCVALDVGSIPDISAISGPLPTLSSLVERCVEDIRPLSRQLSRHPNWAGTLLAAAVTPVPARSRSRHLIAMRAKLHALTGEGEIGEVRLGVLLNILCEESASTAFRTQVRKHFAKALGAIDLGFEPDHDCGSVLKLNEDATICIFRLGDGQHEASLPPAARITFEMSFLALDDPRPPKLQHTDVLARLISQTEASELQRHRSRVLWHALAIERPAFAAASRRFLALPEGYREIVFQTVMNAVIAASDFSSTTIAALERLFKLARKPRSGIYTSLHALAGGLAWDVRTRRTGSVDLSRLDALRADTVAASAVLDDIFNDESDGDDAGALADATSSIPGLDAAHARLVLALASKPLAMTDFCEMCRAEGLFVAGAIEAINDWALERTGDFAISGDGPVAIPTELLSKCELA